MQELFKNEPLNKKPNKKIRAAIIGCGNIAGGYDPPPPLEWSVTHAGGYLLCPDTELIAAADRDEKALLDFGSKWSVNKLYADYRELLEEEKVDILSICLPTEYHYRVFKDALNYDIDAFFIEKPLSYNFEEAEELIKISEGKVAAVNYFRRWNPSFGRLKQEFGEGRYGRIVKAQVFYTKGVIHNASHAIDLLRYLVGEPSGGRCISEIPAGAEDGEADFYLDFNGDTRVYFVNTQGCGYNIFEIDILAERGRVSIKQRGQQIERFDVIEEPFYKKFDIIEEEMVEETEWRNCTTRAITEIVNCRLHGGSPSCTMVDGVRALEISLVVVESGRSDCQAFQL
jgi:predicted dehydrogenase